MLSETDSAKLEASIRRLEAKLSPEERAKVRAWEIEAASIARRINEYDNGLLRRLGVQSDIEDRETRWIELMAAAHVVGISEEEFWTGDPRKFWAVLEHKATELDLLHSLASAIRAESKPSSRRVPPKTDPMKAAERQAFMAAHIAPTLRKPTLNALGENIGIGQSSLSRWYRGQQKLRHDNVDRLAAHLNVKAAEIPN